MRSVHPILVARWVGKKRINFVVRLSELNLGEAL
jgi:hypothetical protein